MPNFNVWFKISTKLSPAAYINEKRFRLQWALFIWFSHEIVPKDSTYIKFVYFGGGILLNNAAINRRYCHEMSAKTEDIVIDCHRKSVFCHETLTKIWLGPLHWLSCMMGENVEIFEWYGNIWIGVISWMCENPNLSFIAWMGENGKRSCMVGDPCSALVWSRI